MSDETQPTTSPFIHLHCHSEFSLLEGTITLKELLKSAAEHAMPAVALTDNGVMFGAIDFYLEAKAKGIKPIIGCEMYIVPDTAVRDRRWQRLILLAKDYSGYQSLIKLVSLGNLEGFYFKPRITYSQLAQYHDNMIAISPGYYGPVARAITDHDPDRAESIATQFKTLFGEDFYLGLTRLELAGEDLIIETSLEISRKHDIPVVATNDVYYTKPELAYLRDVLDCIRTSRIYEQDNSVFRSQDHCFRSPAEMQALFSDIPEALENTVKIADKCNIKINTDRVTLPNFECPDGLSDSAYMEKLVWEGIHKLYDPVTPEIKERVQFELDIIGKMGYAKYFLIIWDFLDHARKVKIPIGPGRGSAAGSIVSYALRITDIDPLPYNLLFERFLNPERVSMPDIDLDFCIKRRNEIFAYLSAKYGSTCVSQIATFGTMASRAVVRDVGRVMNIPLPEVDRIAKLIPSTPGHQTPIHKTLINNPDPKENEYVPELAKAYETPEIKRLLDTCMLLEGHARHTSMHAAGVVISNEPLDQVVPLIKNEGQTVTQYSMTVLEKIGLLKMDILGLRNLTVINDAIDLIREHKGVEINIATLPLDDQPTYDLLCAGNTIGVFQLESRGMRQLIQNLRPQVFEDIIALLALYRPGPLGSGMVNDFISNKSGKTQVKYQLPELEPILKDTYGMVVYQEQVMQIASVIGGFSLGEADMLRRAMGKKKKEEMDKMKDKFMSGAKSKGFDLGKAEFIFELCYKFAEYGFNKSHSAAYALVSYQTAYLKANYPVEYLTALMSSTLLNADKTSMYIEDARQMKIEVLPPDINESNYNFAIVNNRIRIGLGAIKNIGEGAIQNIMDHRKTNPPFKSLIDLCSRSDLKQVNKRVIENLIKAGAFDQLGDRSALILTYEAIIDRGVAMQKERQSGQISLFGGGGADEEMSVSDESFFPEDYPELTHMEKLRLEKELLGLYVSGHPLDKLKDLIERQDLTISMLGPEDDGKTVTLIGILNQCRKTITKTKREMLLGNLEDLESNIAVLVFQNEKFNTFSELFKDENIVMITGKVRLNQEELSLMANDIQLVKYAVEQQCIHMDLGNITDMATLEQIKKICRKTPGETPLYIHSHQQLILTHKKYWLTTEPADLEKLEHLVGAGRLWLS